MRAPTAATLARMKRALTALLLLAVVAAPTAFAAAANDHAKVKTLLLTSADLPGYKIDLSAGSSSKLQCADYKVPSQKETAKAQGVALQKQSGSLLAEFTSEAKIYTNAATARAVWTHVFVNHAAGACVLSHVKSELAGQLKLSNLKLVPVKVSVGPIQLGMWDITGQSLVTGTAQPFEIVMAGYLHGRGVSELATIVLGQGAVSDAQQASAAMARKLARSGL